MWEKPWPRYLEEMTEYVKGPHLPDKTSAVILGEKYSNILEKPLKKRGIGIIKVPDNPCVDKRLAGHADLSVFHFGGNKLLLAPYLKGSGLERELRDRGAVVSFANVAQGAQYPSDAQLNSCVVGRNVMFNPSVSCCEIVNYFTNLDEYSMISCKQGYARCCTCVVDEGAIITSDRGIAAAARKNGIEVLEISAGHIALEGFPYGFVGGASFKLEKNILAFTGTLDEHPDKEAILRFLCSRKVDLVYITQQPAFDIGSAIPITEK